MDMEIHIYDHEEPRDERPLFEQLAALEEQLKPSRWQRLLMWFGLKRDERLVKKPWSYP